MGTVAFSLQTRRMMKSFVILMLAAIAVGQDIHHGSNQAVWIARPGYFQNAEESSLTFSNQHTTDHHQSNLNQQSFDSQYHQENVANSFQSSDSQIISESTFHSDANQQNIHQESAADTFQTSGNQQISGSTFQTNVNHQSDGNLFQSNFNEQNLNTGFQISNSQQGFEHSGLNVEQHNTGNNPASSLAQQNFEANLNTGFSQQISANRIINNNQALQGSQFQGKVEPLNLPSGSSNLLGGISTSFSCAGRPYGYYADQDNSCRVYHVCNPTLYDNVPGENYQHSFLCGEGTVFDQKQLTCVVASSAIPCSESSNHYSRNAEFGLPEEKSL